jgi:environmental stress-induced protein Ves
MPWKNGMGSTLEIDLAENKVWRLSAATVHQPCLFSDYPGFDRLLTVWKGEGLLLNEFLMKKNEVFSFSGEEKIYCKNLNDEVTDLGFVFKRDRICSQMVTKSFTGEITLTVSQGIHFIFCLEGHFGDY